MYDDWAAVNSVTTWFTGLLNYSRCCCLPITPFPGAGNGRWRWEER